jgi:hypothetical protein
MAESNTKSEAGSRKVSTAQGGKSRDQSSRTRATSGERRLGSRLDEKLGRSEIDDRNEEQGGRSEVRDQKRWSS